MRLKYTSHEILQDEAFLKLSRQKNSISAVLTVITLLFYYGFILLLAYRPELLASKVSSNINLGIPIGIGTIIVAWILTGIYVWWANTQYDVMVEQVKQKIEEKIEE